jgi:geranylgeranyl diphosphate synthase type II
MEALGQKPNDALMGGAMAIEMIHCASLVHDDLPCFDNADIRRGKPSVHRQFGEDMAVLVGDALIVAAFGVIAKHSRHRPTLVAPLVRILADAVGASRGIIAGQAAESDPLIGVSDVHRMKTGALFEAMAAMAALVAGAESYPWRQIGRKLGMAYQVADDILDAVGSSDIAGKPVSQDAGNAKPNAVNRSNITDAAMRLDDLIESAIETIPECPGRIELSALLVRVATRLCPIDLIPRESRLLDRIVSGTYDATATAKGA